MSEWALLLLVGLPLLALWIRAGFEVIRRRDLTAASRLGWIAALVLLPIIGLTAYIVTRNPPGVTLDVDDADSSRAEHLVQLAEARQRGELADEEFDRQVRALGVHPPESEQAPA